MRPSMCCKFGSCHNVTTATLLPSGFASQLLYSQLRGQPSIRVPQATHWVALQIVSPVISRQRSTQGYVFKSTGGQMDTFLFLVSRPLYGRYVRLLLLDSESFHAD